MDWLLQLHQFHRVSHLQCTVVWLWEAHAHQSAVSHLGNKEVVDEPHATFVWIPCDAAMRHTCPFAVLASAVAPAAAVSATETAPASAPPSLLSSANSQSRTCMTAHMFQMMNPRYCHDMQ